MAREHVGECRPWPQPFREKKALCGLAAAAIVSVSKEIVEAEGEIGGPSKGPASLDVSRILGAYPYGAILGILRITFFHLTSVLQLAYRSNGHTRSFGRFETARMRPKWGRNTWFLGSLNCQNCKK